MMTMLIDAGWTWDGRTLFALEVLVGIYALGVLRLWLRVGRGRGLPTWRVWAFVGAVVALIIALLSPIDTLADTLFSIHMTQHLILMLIAAPLLVLSDFPVALLWALPRGVAHGIGRRLRYGRATWRLVTLPLSVWLIFTVTLWAWHFPAFYEAALHSDVIHFLEHVCFVTAAALFWWVLFKPAPRKQLQYGINVLYLFTTAVQSGALGALLTFANAPWYATYATTLTVAGMSPLGDQQLAGLIMWLPGSVLYLLLASAYFIAWMNAVERAMPGKQALG